MAHAWEAAVEAQIRAAVERGEFDNLPGAGRPLPGRDLPYGEQWWLKGLLERERIPSEALLPTPLLLRKRVERLPDEVRDLPTEAAVRVCAQELNAQIVAWLRTPTGPRVVVRPVDVDELVRQWRRARSGPVPTPQDPRAGTLSDRPARRRRWWRRTPRP
ncbi:DUF1992 domain-containing protein [Micromonospora sp. NPDC023956]|uniref:DnaJ family domain-containing protein n=1 Tax=Micromonospora sp. NPDC023956 TaxID=3155722 RepID=UPI0033E4AA10